MSRLYRLPHALGQLPPFKSFILHAFGPLPAQKCRGLLLDHTVVVESVVNIIRSWQVIIIECKQSIQITQTSRL